MMNERSSTGDDMEQTADETDRTSRSYAILQTLLVGGFAAVFFFDDSARLLAPGVPGAVGAVLCALGLLLMLAAFVSLARAVQVAPAPRPNAELVTRGVYRRLRHPMYTAIVILLIGLFLRKPTLAVAVAAAVVIVFLVFKVRLEERLLLARYSGYAEYKSRSWGILPLVRR